MEDNQGKLRRISEKPIIRKDYSLINARYNLDMTQQKLILKVISLINLEDENFETYKIPIRDLTNDTNTSRLKKSCEILMTQVIKIEDSKGWQLFNWFSSIRYINGEGVIQVRIDKDLKPHLLNLKSCFKTYELKYILNMKSEYAMRIYEMLKQYEKIGNRTFFLTELQDILQVPKSYIKQYIDFRVKVLDISVREINKHSDLIVSYTPVKMGRSVHSINFTIEKNRNNILEKKVEEKIFKIQPDKLEEMRVIYLSYKHNKQKFEVEWRSFCLYNDNLVKKITRINFHKWCKKIRRVETNEVQTNKKTNKEHNNTIKEKTIYRWNYRKAKEMSDKLKDWLEFVKGVRWLEDYYLQDKPLPLGILVKKVIDPDFNREEILLYTAKKEEMHQENKLYIENLAKENIIDVEEVNK
jgi:plasmid replication initiation protein